MSVYNISGNEITTVYDIDGNILNQAYDINGNIVWQADEEWENENQSDAKAWYVSQIGYDTDKSKRATFTNGVRGTEFTVNKVSDDSVVFSGEIKNQMADFSEFTTAGEYYLSCDGVTSYPFKIAQNRIWNVTALPSLKFMEMSRQDAWDTGGNTGYAWRDSHQFSFELNALVMQYMSNPSYYDSLPWDVYNVEQTEYEELQTQDCPNIIWLMKFGVTRYHDLNVNKGVNLHALIKGQIAYFLYLYPHISNYVDATWYQTIRDWCISIWSVTSCNKAWYEVDGGINHNLFTTQAKIGTVKGNLPPGYAIVPNLMMYEVCKRDGLPSASQFLTAAKNNIAWLVNSVDLTDPANTKGQRMNEYITFHALTYAYEMYSEHCPANTYQKIITVARTLINRSNNLWDYTKYDSARWVNLETTGGLCNNPGYVGMMGVYFALARVITNADLIDRLKELAVAHHDHGFGRNPLGRCFDYKATEDFDGAKLGWVSRHPGGYGHSGSCIGVLDGSPKEENFPYDPSGSTGYTEGWVAFNSPWNMALAYLNGENESITDGIGIFAKSN